MPKAQPRPYRLTISVDLPRDVLDRFKAQAKRRKVDLEQVITEILVGKPAAESSRSSSTTSKCKHPRTNPDPKLPGIRECVDCKARLT